MTSTPPQATPFDDVWAAMSDIAGWLTRDQAQMLWQGARALPPGSTVVEIGSHQGRSTVVLAKALQGTGSVIAVDPFVDGRLFGGQATQTLMVDNLTRTGVRDTVELIADYSTRLRPKWTTQFNYLYIDGKHDYWTVTDDLKWTDLMHEGDPVYIHDAYSSIGVTLAIAAHILPGRRLRYEKRSGSLAQFRIGSPTAADRARIVAELPWWSRNVLIKVLLRMRLRGVARRLGHDSPYDPY